MSDSDPPRKRPPGPGRGHHEPIGAGIGQGDGWGGPAKGEGSPLPSILTGVRRGQGVGGIDRKQRDAEWAELLKQQLMELALNAKREETRVNAAQAMLARLEGAPINRNINANVDDLAALSDAELQSEIERLDRAARAAGEGSMAPPVPDELDGVVH